MKRDAATIDEPAGVDPDASRLRVFVSYRHTDTGWAAWALYLMLESRFGEENVFFDNGTLRPGEIWFDEIRSSVSTAGAFLVLIGPTWMSSLIGRLQAGGRDYVATEVEMALRTPSLSVIPVLVDDAPAPISASLPPSMRRLPAHQADRLRQTHARQDIERLIERLDQLSRAGSS